MTTDHRPSLAQMFLIDVEAAVPRKRLFGGDYYECGVVSMLATHVFERGAMLGSSRSEYGHQLVALQLPQDQVERFFEMAAASIARRTSTLLPGQTVGLGALFGRTEFPELLGPGGAELSLHDPQAHARLAKEKIQVGEALRGRLARYFCEGIVFGTISPTEIQEMLTYERAGTDRAHGDGDDESFLGIELSDVWVPDLETEMAHAVETTRLFVESYFPERLASLGWGVE